MQRRNLGLVPNNGDKKKEVTTQRRILKPKVQLRKSKSVDGRKERRVPLKLTNNQCQEVVIQAKRTLDMLGFQDKPVDRPATQALKRQYRKGTFEVKPKSPPKMFDVNKTCFTNPYGLAGVSENELKQAMVSKFIVESSPDFNIPKVSYEDEQVTRLRLTII